MLDYCQLVAVAPLEILEGEQKLQGMVSKEVAKLESNTHVYVIRILYEYHLKDKCKSLKERYTSKEKTYNYNISMILMSIKSSTECTSLICPMIS